MTLAQLAEHTRAMAARAAAVPKTAAARLAPVMVAAAREVIGDAMALRDLEQSTQRERQRLNYPANEPLLREGDFRESIVGGALANTAYAGTNDPRGEWFQWGTPKMKPFSNMTISLEVVIPKAVEIGIQAAREALEG